MLQDEAQRSMYSPAQIEIPAMNVKVDKRNLQCAYCHLKGHVKEQCYKLVGYPAHYKCRNTNDRSQQQNTQQLNGTHMLTSDQYSQLIKLLNSANIQNHQVNMAGKIKCSSNWIVDSGASAHITSNSIIAEGSSSKQQVLLPNNTTLPVNGTGSVHLTDNINLSNVLHVPNSFFNLLSVS